ncbi:orotate phosphoribosyltransferase [Facklamia miroungae]|uniref:Orotate phosphoribosyltransferase n=1 Tax=Facklamia miroungae TaxID=120956 RepID=A0A1G7RIJ7_9LACT|nr:orotate phosphoribosyltransferase [Facklamia miroungae]NKZ29422.1 orotate phosphoribosyltransferase [Facklamia miroungae]SDG09840.1 orotate phosphoribosyltransferase [Facklamia miroungae]
METSQPKNNKEKIANILLDIEAVKISLDPPFTWSSGLKSPIYCDNRLIISHPASRKLLIDAMVQAVKENFADVEVIAGTATAGIPHAAFLAQELDLPMIYVRSSPKGHGMHNQIEGRLKPGEKVLMIEDLISTGGSVIKAAHAVQNAGGQVIGALAIFNYLLEAGRQNFAKETFPLVTLSDYVTLIDIVTQKPDLAEHKHSLAKWYKDPQAWSQAFN